MNTEDIIAGIIALCIIVVVALEIFDNDI